ncbi:MULTISPECIES: carbohydrate ABC transporter permease [Streptosporangium]|uniref:N-acetylglucosamine transport system permease protein n=1 Tax=Streptosporangium brasiliense TaxID=47480 RepID=A0ABT9RJA0_9ACTN|nr:carbohydrate ABC transporter permease [Streptosporangium brasiliense]MDP9869379.1 N-acetylglucosamine transport system permease protein [Streptosporangium brasiliense]
MIRAGLALIRALIWAWVLFNVGMVVWVLLNSLKSSREIFDNPAGLPAIWMWENFATAWSDSGLGAAAINSVVLTLVSVVLIMALSIPAAYAVARLGGRSSGPVATFFAVGMSIPFQAFAVPMVLIGAGLSRFMIDWVTGVWDTRITVTLFYVVLSLPFSIFVLIGYFRSLPGDVEEAAALDGASPFRTFLQIMVPLAKPGITTVAVLNALSLWNETVIVLMLVPDQSAQTLNVALLNFYSNMQYTSNWGGLFAGVVIVVLPMIATYLWFGRRIVSGMTQGIGK